MYNGRELIKRAETLYVYDILSLHKKKDDVYRLQLIEELGKLLGTAIYQMKSSHYQNSYFYVWATIGLPFIPNNTLTNDVNIDFSMIRVLPFDKSERLILTFQDIYNDESDNCLNQVLYTSIKSIYDVALIIMADALYKLNDEI